MAVGVAGAHLACNNSGECTSWTLIYVCECGGFQYPDLLQTERARSVINSDARVSRRGEHEIDVVGLDRAVEEVLALRTGNP